MARSLRNDRLTPADDLRSSLAESEKLLVNLRGSSSNVLDLLQNLDLIEGLLRELCDSGADMRAEEGRWETLLSEVRGDASRIVRHARPMGGMAELRRQNHPDGQGAWWWYLDQEVASRTRKRLLRAGIAVAGVVAVGVVAWLLLKTFFPVDPKVAEAAGKLMDGQSKIQYNGDFKGALPLFQDATALTPDDPEAWLWLGATQQKLGDTAAASHSFGHATELTPNQIDFRTQRATVYLALSMFDESLTDANAVLASDPENPQAEMIVAGVHDAQGDTLAAVQALQQAAAYADKRNMPEISATARFQLGMLLQRMPAAPEALPSPASP